MFKFLRDLFLRPKPPRDDPFDHDKNGTPGGSKPSDLRGLDNLRAEAEALGIKVDKRWGLKTLRKRIEVKRNANG